MNSATNPNEHDNTSPDEDRTREDANRFKKLKRPEHASKRSRTPERLRGMHRRRRKRMDW
ncbi:MAG: hypothetical protein R3C28_11830 [Pirellulaceae bacterium]